MLSDLRDRLQRRIAVGLLNRVVSVWPNPMQRRLEALGADPGTPEYDAAYARQQLEQRIAYGIGVPLPPIFGREVLEIGCGHGGITCYLACLGPRRAVGVDLDEKRLASASQLATEMSERMGHRLAVEFLCMDGRTMSFSDESFDVILADNLFEHVEDPRAVLAECHRVLRPDGRLVVPTFSSIYSKWGLHLKHGIKLPWANLLFSEPTIVEVLRRQARVRPELYEIYPGLSRREISRVRDVRRHRDLNDTTYRSFREQATALGFRVELLRVHPTRLGAAARRLLNLDDQSKILDVLSTGAAAVLVK